MQMFGTFPTNHTERRFLHWMKDNLPSDWMVVTNVVWVTGNGRYVKDGQADFVLIIPNTGMLVLELKGSSNIRVNEKGLWQRKEKSKWVSCKNPVDQMMGNKHQIRAMIKRNMGAKDQFFLYGGLVIYPNGIVSASHPLVDPAVIVDKQGLSNFQQRCLNVLQQNHQLASNKSISFGHKFAKDVAQMLSGVPHAVIDDGHIDVLNNGAFSNHVQEWTSVQVSTLIGLNRSRRISVLGVAGSGKTQIALNHLSMCIGKGQKVLYMVQNLQLVKWLRHHHPELKDCILSIDELPSKLGVSSLEVVGFQPEFRNAFDQVLLDEAQDLDEGVLFNLLTLVEDGSFITFWDDFQNLFDNDTSILHELDVHYRLRDNKRNPKPIVNFLRARSQTLKRKIRKGSTTIEGQVIKHQLQNLSSLVNLFVKQTSDTQKVVLLQEDSQVELLSELLRQTSVSCTVDIEDWIVRQNMLVMSIKNFKGIESPGVWVCTLKDQLSEQQFWTACTRCTHSLHYVVLSKM